MENNENENTSKQRAIWVKGKFEVITIDGERYRRCLVEDCAAKYKFGSSFNHVKAHWNKLHADMIKQPTDRVQLHEDVWNHKLMLYVIKSRRPFSMVEDRYFREFCNSMDPNKSIILRRDLATRLVSNCRDLTCHVIKKLEEALSLSLTFDIWTASNSVRSFITITCHFIDEDWELRSCILDFHRLEYPHDANTISSSLITTIQRFKLRERVISITADNASVNTCAIDLVKQEFNLGDRFGFLDLQVRCIAHILNLAVKKALSVLDDDLKIIRIVIKKITSSTKQTEIFDKIQAELIAEAHRSKSDLPFRKVYKLIQEVDTRWNSTYMMLGRFLLLRKAIDKALSSMVVLRDRSYVINWRLVEDLHAYLKPSYELTNRLSGQKFSTVSMVSSLLPILMKHTLEYTEDEYLSKAANEYY